VGLWLGGGGLGPAPKTPKPKSQIPNPQSPIPIFNKNNNIKEFFLINYEFKLNK